MRELALRLKADDALQRISSRTGGRVVGEIQEQGFRLSVRRKGVNSWASVLFGTLEPLADGCILRISVGEKVILPQESFGLLFGGLWITVFMAGALPSPTVPLQHKILGLVGFGVVATGSLAIRGFARGAARGGSDTLIRFVEELFADVRVV